MNTQSQISPTFFVGANILTAEPVYKTVESAVFAVDANTQVVPTKHGRALRIAVGNGFVYASLNNESEPLKESYTVTKLEAVREWPERNIKVGQISYKAS